MTAYPFLPCVVTIVTRVGTQALLGCIAGERVNVDLFSFYNVHARNRTDAHQTGWFRQVHHATTAPLNQRIRIAIVA